MNRENTIKKSNPPPSPKPKYLGFCSVISRLAARLQPRECFRALLIVSSGAPASSRNLGAGPTFTNGHQHPNYDLEAAKRGRIAMKQNGKPERAKTRNDPN